MFQKDLFIGRSENPLRCLIVTLFSPSSIDRLVIGRELKFEDLL